MKIFGRKGLEVRNLGFRKKFGTVWLLVEVYGMKIVLGIYIGWQNRVTIGQNRVMIGQNLVTIGFCNGQKFEEPPKSCHDWVKT